MGGMLVSGLSYFIQHAILDPLLGLLAAALSGISQESLVAAHLPWVSQVTAVSATVAASLFALVLAWRALQEYVLWNEGSSSDATGWWSKGVLRVAIYGSIGTWLAYSTFQFGIWLAAAYMAAPLLGNVQVTQSLSADIASSPNVAVGMVLLLSIGLVGVIITLVIVTLQMAVRAAELVFYVVAAPLVALGQFNRDGGIWNNWWRSLVVLSLSQAVQWLGLKGMLATTQLAMDGSSASAGGAAMTSISIFLIIILMLSWAWATIRGPHLLREWSYRSGIGGSVGYIGGMYMQNGGLQKLGGFFGGKSG